MTATYLYYSYIIEDLNLQTFFHTLAAELAVVRQPEPAADTRPVAMEKLVRELIRDRLLTLSRYITLDSSTRTILIDQTSLSADGYQVVTH